MYETLAKIDFDNRVVAMAATWGVPQPNERHYGKILYVNGVVSDIYFETLDGQWLASEYFSEFMGEHCSCEGIFLFDGYFKIFKNGNYKLVGKLRELSLLKIAENISTLQKSNDIPKCKYRFNVSTHGLS